MNKQPELHTTNLLMQPLSISFENAALQILRFSKIHENTHAWVIPLHTHPTIELHYILSGAGQIQIDDTLFHVETNDIYVTRRLSHTARFPLRRILWRNTAWNVHWSCRRQ